MGTFDPRPSYRAADRMERMSAAIDMPFTFTQALGQNFQQGILDSYGLGTVIRDTAEPGNLGERFDNRSGYKPMLDPFGLLDSGEASLTEDEYKSSPFYREVVPWEAGMTEDRAAALAKFADERAVRQHFSEKQPVAAFLGQLGGQALDPINYIPIAGPAARLAAVSRFGSIGGRALLGASEAAINTAAFGILTASIRERLGDDTSFAMIANEIATSALIGGAFGGGIGLFSRGRDARERLAIAKTRDALSTVRTAQLGAIAENAAIDSLAKNGEVIQTPNGMDAIEQMQTEVQGRTSGRRELEAARDGVIGNKPGEIVVSPSGYRLAVKPEVVELDDLIHAEGALQVRNRRSAQSSAQVEQIATGLDPAQLMPNISSTMGAPLVGPDNIVDSGNGRTMAIRRAYEAYPDKAEGYRAAIAEAYPEAAGMRQPVLINRRVTELSAAARAEFNADSNADTVARMTPVEVAMMDRAAITPEALELHAGGNITAPSNRAFVSRFLAQLPDSQRGALLAPDGRSLNTDGVRRIENAIVAAAYGDVDPSVVRRFAEATDDNSRAIVGAMVDVAGNWTRMRQAAKAGDIGPEYDATPELTHALRLLTGWRDQAAREGRPVSIVIREGMSQLDLLDGAVPPETQVFVRMFFANDHFAKAIGRETLAGRLDDIVTSAYELGRPSLFGDTLPVVSKLEVLQNAGNRNAEADIFAVGDVLSRAEEGGKARVGPAAGADRGLDRQGPGESPADRVTEPALFADVPVNSSAPKPDPVPDGLKEAAAAVGQPVPPNKLAEQFGIDDAGKYPEEADVEQLRAQGMLTPDDEAALAAADSLYDDASAYAETLRVAARCMI